MPEIRGGVHLVRLTGADVSLVVIVPIGGIVRGDGIECLPTCQVTVAQNTVVKLAAIPKPGYAFAGWGGACSGIQPDCWLPMDTNKTVSAKFAATPQ